MKVISSRRDFILGGITFAFTLGSGIGFAQQRLPGSLEQEFEAVLVTDNV
jgi:hypothetical protein